MCQLKTNIHQLNVNVRKVKDEDVLSTQSKIRYIIFVVLFTLFDFDFVFAVLCLITKTSSRKENQVDIETLF